MMKFYAYSLTVLFCALTANAAPKLKDFEKMREFYNLTRYPFNARLANLKIAVLDNGFQGYEEKKGFLPDSTVLVETYSPELITKFGLGDPKENLPLQEITHGRLMAQIAWAMTGMRPEGPKFYLLNAVGITNFRRAVRYAIEEKVDIILYSQNRECCGNFDGNGFINDTVNTATQSGILWVNAAGNYGGRVYNGPVQVGADGFLTFNGATSLRIKSHLDDNGVQIILNWNSQGPEETTGTNKDLDLYLMDAQGNTITKSENNQVLRKDKLGEGETFLPRERIRTALELRENAPYQIRIRAKTNNFTSLDRLRVVVIPEKQGIYDAEKKKDVDAVEFLDRTQGGEIFVPADNPNVLTVGDLQSYSASGPTADGRNKPEIVLERTDAIFTDGDGTSGSSNAAAYFAGIAAVMKAQWPGIQREHFLRYMQVPSNQPQKPQRPQRPQTPQNPQRPVNQEAPIYPVSANEIAQRHSLLMQILQSRTGEAPILTGRYQNGIYVLGMPSEPERLTTTLCGPGMRHQGAVKVEHYILQGRLNTPTRVCRQNSPDVLCCERAIYRNGADPYPWQVYADIQAMLFLQIRQAVPATENQQPSNGGPQQPENSGQQPGNSGQQPQNPNPQNKPVWKTPNPN